MHLHLTFKCLSRGGYYDSLSLPGPLYFQTIYSKLPATNEGIGISQGCSEFSPRNKEHGANDPRFTTEAQLGSSDSFSHGSCSSHRYGIGSSSQLHHLTSHIKHAATKSCLWVKASRTKGTGYYSEVMEVSFLSPFPPADSGSCPEQILVIVRSCFVSFTISSSLQPVPLPGQSWGKPYLMQVQHSFG